jgi:phage baseplate assembly protein W
MANGVTYGITFPFRDSFDGKYLDLTDFEDQEIRSSLIHLLLTRKGARYFLPDFGTRLYEYIFEPLDGPTFNQIESEIRDSVGKYIPNLQINTISITDASTEEGTNPTTTQDGMTNNTIALPGRAELEYTAKVRIDYTITNNVFNQSDFIIINI